MATTKREDILVAFLARMVSVHAGAVRGFYRVLDDNLPDLCVYDGTEVARNVVFGKQNLTLTVNVNYAKRLTATDNASIIANEMIGQVVKYAISTDPTLSGKATTIRYKSSTISYPDFASSWTVGIDVAFDIEYMTNFGDPYN